MFDITGNGESLAHYVVYKAERMYDQSAPYMVYKAELMYDKWAIGDPSILDTTSVNVVGSMEVCFDDWFMTVAFP